MSESNPSLSDLTYKIFKSSDTDQIKIYVNRKVTITTCDKIDAGFSLIAYQILEWSLIKICKQIAGRQIIYAQSGYHQLRNYQLKE